MADCAGCGGELVTYPRKDGTKRNKCKGCHNLQVTLSRYKMTREQYDEMHRAAEGKCGICGEEKKLVIDHDHNCCPTPQGRVKTCGNCTRGLLCHRCNTGLAFMEGEHVDAAQSYLRRMRRHPDG